MSSYLPDGRLGGLVRDPVGSARPFLVGSSWGAMLALAYAAAHPSTVRGLVLIGCGTFDVAARGELERTLRQRIDARLRAELDALETGIRDPDERLRTKGELLLPLYCHDPVTLDLEDEVIDARAHEETWADMLRLQAAGVYPAAFSVIEAPVLMLHGARDPHPGRMIRRSLEAHLPQLEYREWEACGHYPWLERSVRDGFYAFLIEWLERAGGSPAAAAT